MSKVYSLAKQAERVARGGITKTWWLEILAVGKEVKTSGFEVWVPANEFICASLGTLLGLPIPPFSILEKRNNQGIESLWFASLDYRLSGEEMPEIDPEAVFKELPQICAGAIVFDLWILNTDRHCGNFSFDPTTSPKRLNIFDHSHALFRFEGEMRLERLKDVFTLLETSESEARRHCLMDFVVEAEELAPWIHKIKSIPRFMIEDICRSAVEMKLINELERQRAVDFLLYRRDNLARIIALNWNDFKSLHTKPMIWEA